MVVIIIIVVIVIVIQLLVRINHSHMQYALFDVCVIEYIFTQGKLGHMQEYSLPNSRVCVGTVGENTSMALSLVLDKHT